jgi:hypothetical protein
MGWVLHSAVRDDFSIALINAKNETESSPIWYESEQGNVFPTRYESEAK